MTTPNTIDTSDRKVIVAIVVLTEHGNYLSDMRFTNVSLTVLQEAVEHINVNG